MVVRDASVARSAVVRDQLQGRADAVGRRVVRGRAVAGFGLCRDRAVSGLRPPPVRAFSAAIECGGADRAVRTDGPPGRGSFAHQGFPSPDAEPGNVPVPLRRGFALRQNRWRARFSHLPPRAAPRGPPPARPPSPSGHDHSGVHVPHTAQQHRTRSAPTPSPLRHSAATPPREGPGTPSRTPLTGYLKPWSTEVVRALSPWLASAPATSRAVVSSSPGHPTPSVLARCRMVNATPIG